MCINSVSDGSIFDEFGDLDFSDETLAMLDMTEFSVNCGKNAVQNTEMVSSPATSRYTIAPGTPERQKGKGGRLFSKGILIEKQLTI